MSIRKKLFLDVVKHRGWNVEVYDIDFRKDDCLLNYGKDIMLKLTKDDKVIYLLVTGQIRVYGKRDGTEFVYRGKGYVRGVLTPYLRKYGNWENNNWFEVFYSEDWNFGGSVHYSLREAVDEIIDYIMQGRSRKRRIGE